MSGTRSFRRRIFLAILVVALVPAALAVVAGTLTLREIGSTVGTLGPWDAVAESGRTLIEEATRAAPEDSAVAAAARSHGDALSRSVRWSRLSSFVTERFVHVLPWLALGTALVIAALAFLTARRLSKGFSRPIGELVGWTERIARSEPLPEPDEEKRGGIPEFRALRTSLRAMAAQLAEARRRELENVRLKAWTEMARRVAHELKNPLTPMRMAARSLTASDDPRSAEAGEVLLEEIARLDEMARTFSQFGRMPEGPPSDVDVGELVEGIAGRYDEGDIPVEVDVESGLPRVRGHYDALFRAVRNLMVNAVEAVEGETDRGEGAERPGGVRARVERAVDGVRVVIRDEGPGIPEEVLAELWQPGVTTKRKGTGLGLAMVRQTVERHGGAVSARNVAGAGAEFELFLPLNGLGEEPGRSE